MGLSHTAKLSIPCLSEVDTRPKCLPKVDFESLTLRIPLGFLALDMRTLRESCLNY